MELYLLRHGIAEDTHAAGGGDAARELTQEGKDQVSSVIRTAARAGMKASVILSSPYVRAVQTARVAARELSFDDQIVTVDSLVPHGSPEAVWKDLRDFSGESGVLLVGHEPLMSTLVAYFLAAPSLKVEMKKAALVRIDLSPGRSSPHGVLRWMLTPRHCSLLSKK